jgi:hypothetical protein
MSYLEHDTRGYTNVTTSLGKRGKRSRVYLHRVEAEEALGKALPEGAEVHHFGGAKKSNILVLCPDHAYHMMLHQRERALDACGNASWRKCVYCRNYDDPTNMTIPARAKQAYHKKCAADYQRSLYND